MGYKACSGDSLARIRNRIEILNISISHFTYCTNPVTRSPENIFVENSTASQSTLRKYFIKGNYIEYKCAICGAAPVWQGKNLTLILDHINGKNNDDRFENLRWVCPNCNSQLETTRNRNPNRKIHARKFYCVDCGKEISNGSIRCLNCEIKHKQNSYTNEKVTREELKMLIRTKTFTEIGEQFGVTDNAIRKWCKKYKLPSTKKEINKISNEDWKNI